jgi:hypothetical protein
MKKVLFVVVLIMGVLVVNAQVAKTDFAGIWTLNSEKSTQPQGGMRMGGGNFVAAQEANLLTVERTRAVQDVQSTTMTMKYTLDGKESINTSPRGDSKSVANWSADGDSLTIETSRTMDMNGKPMIMKSKEIWALADAKTLTVAATREGPDGEEKATMVYDKK